MNDYLRVATVFLLLFDAALIPFALGHRRRPSRVWLLLTFITIVTLSCVASIVAHLGHSLVWYRTPVLFIGAVVGLIYVASEITHKKEAITMAKDTNKRSNAPGFGSGNAGKTKAVRIKGKRTTPRPIPKVPNRSY